MSFRDGVMYVQGRAQRPVRTQNWRSTNGLTIYTAIEWVDPATGERRTSCNCRGWTNAKTGQKRCCCHTKDMEGVEFCGRDRVDQQPVRLASVADVERHVPSVKNTRELRAIMLD